MLDFRPVREKKLTLQDLVKDTDQRRFAARIRRYVRWNLASDRRFLGQARNVRAIDERR